MGEEPVVLLLDGGVCNCERCETYQRKGCLIILESLYMSTVRTGDKKDEKMRMCEEVRRNEKDREGGRKGGRRAEG